MAYRNATRSAVYFVAALLLSASAHAQLFRTYLASGGNDANPCTLAQPCRLLPAALATVAINGEIWMLDSANYNTATVTIDKSVSILAVPGAVGSVLAIAGPAVSITASALNVVLRNLVIGPLPGGGGLHGVSMTGASRLTIEHSLIANNSLNGVDVQGTGMVKAVETIFRNNLQAAIWLENGATGMISRTQMLGNPSGIVAVSNTATTTRASMTDSVISGLGSGLGVIAYSTVAGADARIFVTRSTIEGTHKALGSDTPGPGSALVTVSNSTIMNNDHGWSQLGGGSIVRSLGNNHIADNMFGGMGLLTPVPLQ